MKKSEIKKLVVKTIEDYIADEQIGINYFNQIKYALKPFIGKPINKRLVTAIEKHFGDDYIVTSDFTSYGQKYVSIRRKGEAFDDRKRFFLGYDTTEAYQEGHHEEKHSGFNYFSGSFGAWAIERCEKNQKILDSKELLTKLVDAIEYQIKANELLNDDRIGSYDFPARFSIDKILKCERGING